MKKLTNQEKANKIVNLCMFIINNNQAYYSIISLYQEEEKKYSTYDIDISISESFAFISANIAESGLKMIEKITSLWEHGYGEAMLSCQDKDTYDAYKILICNDFPFMAMNYQKQLREGIINYVKKEYGI